MVLTKLAYPRLADNDPIEELSSVVPINRSVRSDLSLHRPIKLKKVDRLAVRLQKSSFWKMTGDRPVADPAQGEQWQLTALLRPPINEIHEVDVF
ncbi:hypothetical protein [Bradyrhizobium sp. 5.13L]